MLAVLCLSATSSVAAVVPTVPVGTAGQRMPMISLGTGSGQHGDVENATAMWLQCGASGIDTAYIYHDQDQVGAGVKAVGASWDSIFLTTKIPCSSKLKAKANIASDLKQLGVATVDLILIHEPHPWPGQGRCDIAGTWAALEEAQAKGQVKSIGVSNFKASDLKKLAQTATVAPALNQCSHSVSLHDDETAAYCDAQGIVYMSYSPLCGGSNGSSCKAGSVLKIPLVQQIAKAHGVSAAQVGLKWVVQQGRPLATAVWRKDYMLEDIDLWSWGDLTPQEMKALTEYAGADAGSASAATPVAVAATVVEAR